MTSGGDRPFLPEWLTALGLFLLALLPRALSLGAFVTVDEAKWVYRSARFLAALLQGDLAGTVVNLTPAVTTTWLGSIGLSIYYHLFRPAPDLLQWLLSLAEFRTTLDVLVAVRWPMVLLTSVSVVLFYLLARRLTGDPPTALIFGLLLALDPQYVALSRVLGHDAPAGLFVGLSLLAWLVVMREQGEKVRWGLLAFSALCAGLALLSKSPAFFLLPFVGLVWLLYTIHSLRSGSIPSEWVAVSPHPASPPRSGEGGWGVRAASLATTGFPTHVKCSLRLLFVLAVWVALAALVFTLVWPAAWQQPLLTPWSVVHNAFLSATDTVEAAAEGHWLVPELGILYYPVNAGFKVSIAATLGLLAWLALLLTRRGGALRQGMWGLDAWLLAFVLLFTLFMTLGGKRSSRYLLPAWPALYLLAAVGLRSLPALLWPRGKMAATGVARKVLGPFFLGLLLALPLAYTYPYYLSYFNPFLGGPWTAPRLVKIGWGEGMDQAGRWLQQSPDAPALRVGADYGSTLAPFFDGSINPVTAEALDYVVLYIKQVQSGEPSPAILRYYEGLAPLHTVSLAGVTYARVYPGPAMRPALSAQGAPTAAPPADSGILPKPLAFRLSQPYLPVGGSVAVEVIWLAEPELPVGASELILAPLADLTAPPGERSGAVYASARGWLEGTGDGLVRSRYDLTLPPELPREDLALLVDGRPLGWASARLLALPQGMQRVDEALFGDQVALAGYTWDGAAGELVLAWQAAPKAWADYTVFLHVLDAEGVRVAGVDVQPQPPSSSWAQGEVALMRYAADGPYGPALPADLPSGEYGFAVGLYAPLSGERLTLPDGADVLRLPLSLRVE
jgi:hypothetical protein